MYISEPAEYAILGLLHSQPMHGYEMFQEFRNSTLEEIAACRNFLDHLESKHSQHARHPSVLPTTLPRGQDKRREERDDTFFEHVVLRGRIYQTRSLLDWLHELQHELAEVE